MLFRRLRGVLGASGIWALAWVPLGVAFGISPMAPYTVG